MVQNAQGDGLIQTICLVEGTGVGAIQVSDIVTRHGVRAPAADADKHFTAAFVAVSAMPEPDATLDQVGHLAAVLGRRPAANRGRCGSTWRRATAPR